jgi:hypothetical protein
MRLQRAFVLAGPAAAAARLFGSARSAVDARAQGGPRMDPQRTNMTKPPGAALS